MRTSGGRGAEGWMLAVPLLAVTIAGIMSGGGPHEALMTAERTIRDLLTAMIDWVRGVF